MKKRLIASLVLTTALPLTATALPATAHYECDFPRFVDDKGLHEGPPIRLSYLYNAAKAYAQINEPSGNHKVQPVVGESGQISFIEISALGNVAVTTILEDGSAIHSRNTALDGAFVSALYYGSCSSPAN